ncbi:MAG: amidotransferase 1, exosortase A system-associated [Magnetococcales bacterium]|nr:amidotransferase 1, exosortase A system-associated [Magnetococcales bacterium]
MCGVAGFCDLALFSENREVRSPDAKLLEEMTDALSHRGPDQRGTHCEAGIGLGHRRLSIIDLSESGRQPMFNEDHSICVIFNGELYNHHELRQILKQQGHRFRSRTDTEVLVHGWESWGMELLDRIRGMFAFVLWDRKRKELLLARDRLGIKPLYYARTTDGWLVFGSELKALMKVPTFERRLNPQAVEEYCALGYVPDPRTIFTGMHKLEPATTLRFAPSEAFPEPVRYWQPPFGEEGPWRSLLDQAERSRSEEGVTQALWERLRESVQVHRESDVPLGAFLSGGVDSTAIVALLSEMDEQPVKACTVSFGERRFDESPYAIEVAERFQADHSLERADPLMKEGDPFSLLAGLYDEPFADDSALPTWMVCGLARKQVTVALAGDGGDETLGGYRRYRFFLAEERVRSKIPSSIRRPVFGALGRLYPKMDWAPQFLRAKSTFQALERALPEALLHGVSMMPDTWRNNLYTDAFDRELAGYRTSDLFVEWDRKAGLNDPLDRILSLDFHSFLPGRILTKTDRASMAHGLEVRVPMLDHHFVEWAVTLPSLFKIRNGEGKYLLKKALEPSLPQGFLKRPKMGFSTPLSQWLRGSYRQHLTKISQNGRLFETGWFSRKGVQQMVNAHLAGQRDYASALWGLLMFEAFLEHWDLPRV